MAVSSPAALSAVETDQSTAHVELPLVPSVSSKVKLTRGAGHFHTSASCVRLTGVVGDLLSTKKPPFLTCLVALVLP